MQSNGSHPVIALNSSHILAASWLRIFALFTHLVAVLRCLLQLLLHVSRVLEFISLLRRNVLLESNFACGCQTVQSVHGLIDLTSVTEVGGLFNLFIDLLSVLVDEDREHFLRVLFLTVLCYRFSIDHDFLSRHSLRSLLHHLLLLHAAHRVIELHVRVVPNEHSLLSHNLLLLSLVLELSCVEELVLQTWLTAIRGLQHIRVNEDGSCVHQHSLLTIRTLSWSTVLWRSGVLVKASGCDISHLAWVEHRRCHQLRIHILWHIHLFPVLSVGHLRRSHL